MTSPRVTLESFASEYHDMKDRSSSYTGRRSLPFARIGPWPQLLTQDKKPGVIHWIKEIFLHTLKDQSKGETDGNAITVTQKNKAGRPRKSTGDDGVPVDQHKHRYLEREDGTPISTVDLRLLSQKARENWETLFGHGYAPKTWGQISSVTWEFYAQSMLNKPGLEFLHLCDDGQWKLREWTQLNYSGWAKRRGIREGRILSAKKETGDSNGLDDEGLIQMESHSEEEAPEDVDADKTTNGGNQKSDLGPDSGGNTTNPVAGLGDIPSAPVNPTTSSAVLEEILTHSLGCKPMANIGRGQSIVIPYDIPTSHRHN